MMGHDMDKHAHQFHSFSNHPHVCKFDCRRGQEEQEEEGQEEGSHLDVHVAYECDISLHLLLPEGKSSSTSPSEESAEVPEVDVPAALGLPSKEFMRSSKQSNLDDLSVRQLACALSGVYVFMLPSDMMDVGGSYESWQRLFVYSEVW